MSAIVYPSTLPGPSVSVVTPAERRLLSDLTGGPQQARGLQSDYLAQQAVEWEILTAAEAAAFGSWWADSLTYGGAWFASTWPAPQGWVSIVRRFIGAPKWQHLHGGFWKVTAQVLVRGRGLAPVAPDMVNLDGLLNAGSSSGVGVVLSGLDPAGVYYLSEPTGQILTAWRPNAVGHSDTYENVFSVTSSLGTTTFGTIGSVTPSGGLGYTSAEAARAAFPGGSITGASSYTFWINDYPNFDNDMGLSIRVQRGY